MMALTPELTCTVVDMSPSDPDLTFNWYLDNREVQGAGTFRQEEQHNSTHRMVSTLLIQHDDWLQGKTFKVLINSQSLPAPIERTIRKRIGTSPRS